jgi:hypothetical protein
MTRSRMTFAALSATLLLLAALAEVPSVLALEPLQVLQPAAMR